LKTPYGKCHVIFRIAIDPVFPPPDIGRWNGGQRLRVPDNILEQNRFELIFDELLDGKDIQGNL
jgi:tubulin monoglycylase TTLL3/8